MAGPKPFASSLGGISNLSADCLPPPKGSSPLHHGVSNHPLTPNLGASSQSTSREEMQTGTAYLQPSEGGEGRPPSISSNPALPTPVGRSHNTRLPGNGVASTGEDAQNYGASHQESSSSLRFSSDGSVISPLSSPSNKECTDSPSSSDAGPAPAIVTSRTSGAQTPETDLPISPAEVGTRSAANRTHVNASIESQSGVVTPSEYF